MSKFKVFVYRGNNQNKAVRDVLVGLGYDYFRINDHGYCNGLDDKKAAGQMWKYLDILRRQYEKEAIPHFDSNFRNNDIEKREKVLREKQLEYFYFILNNSKISNDLLEKIKNFEERGILEKIDFFTYYNNDYGVKDVMISLVLEIGLDNILKLTREFNSKYIEELKAKKGLIK